MTWMANGWQSPSLVIHCSKEDGAVQRRQPVLKVLLVLCLVFSNL